MEMQPPVSPQQSECNPVGALQVCPHPRLPCMPIFPWTRGSKSLWVGQLPCTKALPHPSFLSPRI